MLKEDGAGGGATARPLGGAKPRGEPGAGDTRIGPDGTGAYIGAGAGPGPYPEAIYIAGLYCGAPVPGPNPDAMYMA
jgi:hypothetical protein